MAATDITQFHGPAPYLFALQVTEESCPMTPPSCLMGYHYEPIRKLVRSTESIFEHQTKRFSRDRGVPSYRELIFETTPYKIRLMGCGRVADDET